MLIDWFTVGAQALNFIILAWLMKRFLYKPILNAIDAREERIATELASAARKETEAQQQRDEFQKKNDDLHQQRAALLKQARADAAEERQKLMGAAREAADALAAQRQASLVGEAKKLGQALRQRTQTEVFAIARRALTDLAGASLEASACAVFITRLHDLEGEPKAALAAAMGDSESGVVVRSAFELPSDQRLAIQNAIADSLGVKPELRFEVETALVGGIELVAQGQKLAWTISDYLTSLERGVRELLQAPAVAP
ncbi:F0F1 ATP synthase subunit B [Hydrogenophaga sp. PAMC20947]|uniref:F0F1 ATP synthase subunit B family protein n=1 Tax=Hydrogenophaga sp. PAMC20947 TaxID=2565558 RepID=UPI00109D9F71|nr:F0F1 ATP synthase subunit B [Hydrogenophaga sp. PAMC20947]QCB45421.1 F0F1 ATP synthase subunit B [Hydrogenophaga sp. PAMC20947]